MIATGYHLHALKYKLAEEPDYYVYLRAETITWVASDIPGTSIVGVSDGSRFKVLEDAETILSECHSALNKAVHADEKVRYYARRALNDSAW